MDLKKEGYATVESRIIRTQNKIMVIIPDGGQGMNFEVFQNMKKKFNGEYLKLRNKNKTFWKCT